MTIAAISTAVGEAGIGIVRMSGKNSLNIANKIFKGNKVEVLDGSLSRKLTYGHIVNKETEEIIDENEGSKSSSQEVKGDELENNKFSINSQSNREYSLDVYEKAIDTGYIEIKWEERGEKKTEKITIEIVD